MKEVWNNLQLYYPCKRRSWKKWWKAFGRRTLRSSLEKGRKRPAAFFLAAALYQVLIQKWKQPKIKGWSFPTNRHIRHRTFIFNFDQYFFSKRIFYTPFFVLFKRIDYFFPFTIRTCKESFVRNFFIKDWNQMLKKNHTFLNFTSE